MLRQLKTESAASVLKDQLFEDLRKHESRRTLEGWWSLNRVSDWREVPYEIGQHWYQVFRYSGGVKPRCFHWYVKGGPYHTGGGTVLDLKPVWLVTDAETLARKVVTAVPGNKDDVVAIYVIRIYDSDSGWFDFLDPRWGMVVRSLPECKLDGRPKTDSDVKDDCERRCVAQYIDSSKDKKNQNHTSVGKSTLQRFKAMKQGQLLQNCAYFYPHNWNISVTKAGLFEKPWLATIAFKLTDAVAAYTELAYDYDWWANQRSHEETFMVPGKTCRTVRLSKFRTTPGCAKTKKKQTPIGMAGFVGPRR